MPNANVTPEPTPEPSLEPTEVDIIGYIIHLEELWNIERLQGGPEIEHNTKKVIACFTDPRRDWFTRTRKGLCKSARISMQELSECMEFNASTFMINEDDRITLRVKMLRLSRDVITHYYELD